MPECSNVKIRIIKGILEIRFIAHNGTHATTSLDAGNSLVFDPIDDTLTASETNTEIVLVQIQRVLFSIEPGKSIRRGGLNGDGDIDRDDLSRILSHRNKLASLCPECDLDGDGKITALYARKLVLLCTCSMSICP